MLSQPFQRFIEASPVTVMLRGIVERTLNAEWLDAWFERTAESQYTYAGVAVLDRVRSDAASSLWRASDGG